MILYRLKWLSGMRTGTICANDPDTWRLALRPLLWIRQALWREADEHFFVGPDEPFCISVIVW